MVKKNRHGFWQISCDSGAEIREKITSGFKTLIISIMGSKRLSFHRVCNVFIMKSMTKSKQCIKYLTEDVHMTSLIKYFITFRTFCSVT